MLSISFRRLLTSTSGERYLERFFKEYEKDKMPLFKRWYQETGETGEVFPSQGLLITPFDYLPYVGKTLMSEEELWRTLKMRHYVLTIFNHPERLVNLRQADKGQFKPPKKIIGQTMEQALARGVSLAVRDLGLRVLGTNGRRIARRQLLLLGPFLKIGRFARIPFSGGAMPDIFGAPAALATMAACHGLACIPRNGPFYDIKRQAALAKAAGEWLKEEPLLSGRREEEWLVRRWQKNLVGVVEPGAAEALKRAEALYKVGIRAFRVYSPEPGREAELAIRQLKKHLGAKIEVFVGQVASLEQAKRLEVAGADGLYVGIGGGGRCTTAVRSGSVVDWPELLWRLRGVIKIPVIVEGGGSEHIGVTLALGGSGVGVSRLAGGGTIESPGGLLYLVNKKGQWFKPYGGEASARTKYQDNKMLACGLPAFVEGETTKALKSYIPHVLPTLAQNIFFLVEDLILSLVFRGVAGISQLQNLEPSPLRQITPAGAFQQNTH